MRPFAKQWSENMLRLVLMLLVLRSLLEPLQLQSFDVCAV
jgi:hypothetical protein